jgi:hypothetical protein
MRNTYQNLDDHNSDGIGQTKETEIRKFDTISKPAHYNQGKIETIDTIKDSLKYNGFLNYIEGNVLKYVLRWKFKNGVEDLKKARWYLDKLIQEIEVEK